MPRSHLSRILASVASKRSLARLQLALLRLHLAFLQRRDRSLADAVERAQASIAGAEAFVAEAERERRELAVRIAVRQAELRVAS